MTLQKAILTQFDNHYLIKFKSGLLKGKSIKFPITESDRAQDILKHLIYTYHEIDSYFQIPSFFSNSPIVIDCGSYPGEFTLMASQIIGKKGTVISVEPSPVNSDYVHAVLEFNKHPKNIVELQNAISNTKRKGTLSENRALSRLITNDGITARLTTIDELIYQYRYDNQDILIKMDIEGEELKALEGARKTIQLHKPDIMVASYHVVDGMTTQSRVEHLLLSAGYKFVKTLFPNHPVTYATMRKPTKIYPAPFYQGGL